MGDMKSGSRRAKSASWRPARSGAVLTVLMLLVAWGNPAQQQGSGTTADSSTGYVTHSVTNVSLSGRSLPDYADAPGIYVQLYRPHGVIDNAAPLPFHITVLNNTGAALVPWELGFDYDGAIDHAWNATIREDGGRFLVQPEAWNAALNPGEVRQFGFVGRSDNLSRRDPTSFLLHGIEVEWSPSVAATGHEECLLDVSFVVQAQGTWWSTQPHSFFGEFYLRNVGSEPAEWALQWSMDHRGASGPGTRSVNKWQRLVGGEYYLRSSEFEGPIEPGGMRSFAIWGEHPRQPYAMVACPTGVQIALDPVAEAYRMAQDALTEEERRSLACGRLVWNGTHFVVASPLSGMRPPCN